MKAKKKSESSLLTKRVRKSGKLTSDKDLDFSDIPELTDAELKRAKRVGRPKSDNPKQLIAIRIDPFLLSQIQKMASKQGLPYQTLIHSLLEKAAKKAA